MLRWYTGWRPMSNDWQLETEPGWPVIETKREYETGWYDGGYDLVEQPNGATKRYYWAALRPAVIIVPVVDDQVIFVEQYRPTIREEQLELPAGIVEQGESASTAAARELAEETGYTADGLSVLQSMWVATGVLRHKRSVVFAEGLTPGRAAPEDNEFLTVRPVPRDEALARARESPTNGATINALLLAKEDGLL